MPGDCAPSTPSVPNTGASAPSSGISRVVVVAVSVLAPTGADEPLGASPPLPDGLPEAQLLTLEHARNDLLDAVGGEELRSRGALAQRASGQLDAEHRA